MIDQHVPKRETCQLLAKHGYPQEGAEFYWWKDREEKNWLIAHRSEIAIQLKYPEVWQKKGYVAAPLFSELLERMPKSIDVKHEHFWLQVEVQELQEGWACQYKNVFKCYKFIEHKSLSEALAQMWIATHRKEEA